MKYLLPIRGLAMLLLTIAFNFSYQAVQAQWMYMQSIDITEQTSTTQYNKQVVLTLNTACLVGWGHMEASGDDIRFSIDPGMADTVDYYIMGGMNTNTTKIMVQIDSLEANQTLTMYMHYGNPSAIQGSNLDFLTGPYSSTDSVNVPNTNPSVGAGWTRGFRFTCNHDMLVPNIGSNIPTPGAFVASYWSGAGTLITQQTINPASAMTFLYEDLNEAIIFKQGDTYVATLHSPVANGYRYGPPTTTGPHLTYLNMQYANSSTATTFPTSSLTGQHYGLVDFLYYLIDTTLGASISVTPYLFTETDQVCAGASYTFPDNTTMNNITSSVTHVSMLTSSSACDSAVETTVNVIPVDVSVIQSGSQLTAGASSPASYQWVDCNDGYSPVSGATSKNFTATANGTYAVVITQNLCTDTSACFEVTTIGINAILFNEEVSIFPNPAETSVRIDLHKTCDHLQIDLTNNLGQVVLTYKGQNQSIVDLDISQLPAGVYVVNIKAEDQQAAIKLQKE